MKEQVRCKIRSMVVDLSKPANWICQYRDGQGLVVKTSKNTLDRLPYEVADFLEREFLSPDSPRIYFSIQRQRIEDLKGILWGLGALLVFLAVFFNVFIEYKEIKCKEKGFADVDSKGCFLIKNGEKIYE